MHGIPDNLSLDYAERWVKERVSPKRFKHIEGVARAAKRIARAYGCDTHLAELGGWLHDACKEYKPQELLQQARSFAIPFGQVEEQQGHLLHGPVAAQTVASELGVTNKDLLAAIAEHTLGAVPMCKLSEVLFLADCLEESRPNDYTGPIWAALSLDDEINVDRAMVTATDLSLLHLMETGRPIHPRTIDVRNYYLARVKSRNAGEEKRLL